MSKVTTRQGDKGMTILASGRKVPKDHIAIKLCASIDDFIAYALLVDNKISLDFRCKELTSTLSLIMTRISSESSVCYIDYKQYISHFKSEEYEGFVYPITEEGCYLNVLRTKVRLIEQLIVEYNRTIKTPNYSMSRFFNRLSDIFYSLMCKAESRRTNPSTDILK